MGCYSPKEKRANSDFLILSNSAGTGKNNALRDLLDQLREFKVNSISYNFGYTGENKKLQGSTILNSTLIQITVKAKSQKLQKKAETQKEWETSRCLLD